jgi:probable HAF family extracellular repeat protein
MGHAIVRGRRGRFVQFDVPGAISTIANKISDRGHVVGGYNPTGISVGAPGTKGFVRYGGRLRTIYVPGSIETQALGVNNHGLVVGEYANADGTFHGFTWKRGRLTTFDLPSTNAALSDVNDSGIMVGSYFEAGGTVHGFLRDRRGRVHTIDAPGAPDFTFAADINNRGQIVGSGLNYDSDGNATSAAGFLLRKGVEGPFTPIDFPGALGTIPRGIDDQGRIVGIYANPETSAPAGLQLGMPMPD